MKHFVVIFLSGMLLVSCRPKPSKPEETPTKGNLMLLVTDSHDWVLKEQADEYSRQYPEVHISVAGVSTREAIVHFLNDSVKSICIDRPLNKEELEVAAKANFEYAENKIAEDALAIIVHPQNPLKEILYQDVKEILTGVKKSWSQISSGGGRGTIELVLTGRNSGTYELLQRHFFRIDGNITISQLLPTQQRVVEYISAHPQALGIVSIAAVRNDSGSVKVLAVESTNMEGERFVRPNQINIYRSLYPLHYSLYLYTSESSTGVAAGFSTFVRSMQGQKIIQNVGLVPVVIPNRVIQINTE